MNTTLNIFTKDQITNEFKLKELVTIYNKFATELGIRTINHFSSKATAIIRVVDIQTQYTEEVAELKAKKQSESKPTKKTGSRFDTSKVLGMTGIKEVKDTAKGTIQRSIFEAVITYGHNHETDTPNNTIEDIISEVIRKHKRPRSNQPVDREYVIHNIKWFIKKGSLEIVE